ncbi:MAG: hypothetical protein IJZ20_02820, partial [Clostridia bacterium]|nr:hypothetical protein [Clostridia bacterium]
EGAALNGMSLWTCTEDYLKVGADGIGRTKSAGTDPIVLLHTVTGTFNGKDVQKIRMGIVWDKENVKLTPQLYYATVSSPGYAWQRMFEGKIGETDENGVTEVVFDVTIQSAFQDTVKELRFDPFDLADTEFGIAYIILE